MYFLNLLFFISIFTYSIAEAPLKEVHGKYAIVSNYKLCAKIGENLIKKGGNGFDAAIAVMLCEGVAKPQDMGLGGGFLGLVKRKGNETFVINAREISPYNINLNTYTYNVSSKILGKTIGLPSALKGYATLKRFAKLPWKVICKPVIDMARKGFPVVIGDILNKKQYQYIEEKNRHIFINPKTELPYANGDIWKRPDLAKTIELIAKRGPNAFDNNVIMKEINSNGGKIIPKDFKVARTRFYKPLKAVFVFNKKKYLLETIPLPGGGPSLEFILRIMEFYYKDTKNYKPTNEMYYVLTEAFKYAFGLRGEFGDPRFIKHKPLYNIRDPKFVLSIYKKIITAKQTSNDTSQYLFNSKPSFDTGTANIVIKTPTEIIAITSSINLRFGSWVVSDKYGFIYNNQLSDFSLPTRTDAGHLQSSINNLPEPFKYPISSMSASIVYEYKNKKYVPKYVLGAAGGPKIITSVAQVLNRIFSQKQNIVDAIKFPRFHHQLIPNEIVTQVRFYNSHKKFFKKYGYFVSPIFMKDDYSAVTGLQIDDNNLLSASYDPRRPGSVSIW